MPAGAGMIGPGVATVARRRARIQGFINGVRMTRTFARWPARVPTGPFARARLGAPLAALLAVLLTGCAGGLIGPLPRVSNPATAATVTVFRDFSLPGFFAPITLRIDDRKTFRVWINQAFDFQLDRGEYLFYFTIGFNECRRVVYIQPGRTYRFRLRPNCISFEPPI